jgi:glutamate dehydrogenase (NAD(P)+)
MINLVTKTFSHLGKPNNYSFASGATFLKMVEAFFDRAALHTGIRQDRINFYKKAENVVKCNLSIIRGYFISYLDNGLIETVPAYRCQHKTHKLPTKGGTRYAENVDM